MKLTEENWKLLGLKEEDWVCKGTLLISNLRILHTPAGYYIGRVCVEMDESNESFIIPGYEEPYTRESGYFPNRDKAEKALAKGFSIRDCVENNLLYVNGTLSMTAK